MIRGPEWLNTIHDYCFQLSNEAHVLLDLSEALYKVGNPQLSNDLASTAKVLEEASTKIPQAIGKHLGEDVQKSQQELGNLVTAIIGGKK